MTTINLECLHADDSGYWCDCNGCYVAEITRLRARVAELEAAARWILVSEMTPDVNRRVMLLDKRGIIQIGWISAHGLYFNSSQQFIGVTHWALFPNTPTEKEK